MKKIIQAIFLIMILGFSVNSFGQKNGSVVYGQILDTSQHPLPNIFICIKKEQKGVYSNDSGFFSINVPSEIPVSLTFSGVNFIPLEKIFFVEKNQKQATTIYLQEKNTTLPDVKVSGNPERQETGLVTVDASKALINPSVTGGIEGLLKTFVGSNNELTSQYSVRGGNYDENLVYVNGFEIYRPFLVNSGQQEGLSFINPALTENVKFYTGGFQAKYGDKMSSALDVTYKKPTKNGGSAYMSLLEQGLSLEGISKNKKFTYLFGARNRDNSNVLRSQPTTGSYIPSSSDAQALLTYSFNPKYRLEFLGNYSSTRFTFYPEETKLTANVFSPLFVADYGVDIHYSGSEKDKYNTNFAGLTLIHQPTNRLSLKYMVSYFGDNEQQNTDITGAYIFGERDGNGNIINTPGNILGEGDNQDFARNHLKINLFDFQHQGDLRAGLHFLQWGVKMERQHVNSFLNQWNYTDSAGYSLPLNRDQLLMNDVIQNQALLDINRFSGFLQDNIRFKDSAQYTLQVGVRFNYNNLNKEFIVSPRAGFSFKPKNWEKDIVFKASAGMYAQPPFYREMMLYNGQLNTQLKAQKSWQGVIGMDYNLTVFQRPARWTTEAYYKFMYDVDPYDMDNVQIRYYGNNRAKAYAAGIESRFFAQIVKDADSWLSIGIMRTREKIDGLNYTQYFNAEGQKITSSTPDKAVADSTINPVGWLRRPTDRLITFGMFFQDYLNTNKNVKVYLNTVYGTNLPYNIPGSTRYRNALTIPSYLRMDIGFSALLLGEQKMQRSRSPFSGIKNIWASLEIFNLIDRDNTISYMLLKDFDNNIYALPNRLTPRLLNLKVIVNW